MDRQARLSRALAMQTCLHGIRSDGRFRRSKLRRRVARAPPEFSKRPRFRPRYRGQSQGRMEGEGRLIRVREETGLVAEGRAVRVKLLPRSLGFRDRWTLRRWRVLPDPPWPHIKQLQA